MTFFRRPGTGRMDQTLGYGALGLMIGTVVTAVVGGVVTLRKAWREDAATARTGTIGEYQELHKRAIADSQDCKAEVVALRARVESLILRLQEQMILVERVLARVTHLEWLLKENEVAFMPWSPDQSGVHKMLPPEAQK